MRVTGVLIGVAALALVAGCGSGPVNEDVGSMDRPAAFVQRQVTWAQGPTIHYGARTFTGDGDVDALWRSSYGFVVRVRPGSNPDARAHYVFLDREGTRAITGKPDDIHVSPDGRYAGWIDYDGPETSTGQRAAAVVMDLHTGREVMRDDHDMGGKDDDLADLYEDAEVHFHGFDRTHAYWKTPTGTHEEKQARIGTWKVENGPTRTDEMQYLPAYDLLTGHPMGMGEDGTPSPEGGGFTGFTSPEGRWCVTTGVTAELKVADCRTGRDVTPAYPQRFVFFGGWQDADTLYVQTTPRFDEVVQTGPGDRSTGLIASCSLRTRRCTTVTPIRHTGSVRFATGEGSL